MPRTGVTYDQIAASADALVAEGVTPTIKNVRERLATGSPNTIQKHLAAWREAHPPHVATSAEVNSRAIQTFNQILDQLRSEGRAEIEDRLVLAQAEARELAAQGEMLEDELAKCTEEINSTAAERDALRIKIAEQNAEVARVTAENERERYATELARTEVAQARNKLETQAEKLVELAESLESLRHENAAAVQGRTDAEKAAAVLAAQLQAEQEKSGALALEKESQSTQLATALQAAEENRIKVARIAAELEHRSATLKEKAEEIGEIKELFEIEKVAR